MRIALLSAGKDRPYAIGITQSLVKKNILIDFIGNAEFKNELVFLNRMVKYYDLRGNQDPNVSIIFKVFRIIIYYYRLVVYGLKSRAHIFHILWLNKFLFLDAVILNTFYKIRNKKIVYTAHNINIKKRDGNDSFFNRWCLNYLYNCVDHIFVHTKKMKEELKFEFNVSEGKISIIPFGINNTVPVTELSVYEAREKIKTDRNDFVLLFFGNIAYYKGLDIFIESLSLVQKKGIMVKAIIAGQIKSDKKYWVQIEQKIREYGLENIIIKRIEFIPDKDIEIYFKACDALVLPYRFIYQSGPLFLSYNFGVPVIANRLEAFTDVIFDGKTGIISKSLSSNDFADAIIRFKNSELYQSLPGGRKEIERIANSLYSWESVGEKIIKVYNKIVC
jgi:glycosyltransferase involved in cell wall biosynthesis